MDFDDWSPVHALHWAVLQSCPQSPRSRPAALSAGTQPPASWLSGQQRVCIAAENGAKKRNPTHWFLSVVIKITFTISTVGSILGVKITRVEMWHFPTSVDPMALPDPEQTFHSSSCAEFVSRRWRIFNLITLTEIMHVPSSHTTHLSHVQPDA